MATRKPRYPRGSRGGKLTGKLPPISVHCNGCGGDYLSTAKHMTSTRCSRCGHSNRVKRRQPPSAKVQPAHTAEVFTSPRADTAPAPASAAALAVVEDQDDEDDGTWMYDERGQLVPAEWIPGRGLVPLQPGPSQQAAEMAARGYRENRAAPPGGCRVHESWPAEQDCALAASRVFGALRVCDSHWLALTSSL